MSPSAAPRSRRRSAAAALRAGRRGNVGGRSVAVILGLVVASASAAISPTGANASTGAPQSATASRAAVLPGYSDGNYIVVLREPAATMYEGGLRGLPRTSPGESGAFQAGSAAVADYSAHLWARQDALTRHLGVTITQRYSIALDGFAAHLTSAQAIALSKSPSVLSVSLDAIWHAQGHAVGKRPLSAVRNPRPEAVRTAGSRARVGRFATSDFLGLTRHGRPAGRWNPTTAGKGVVIGVIDTGYWPESDSFAGAQLRHGSRVTPGHPGPIWKGHTHHTRFLKGDGGTFTGLCQRGQRFPADTCNRKVISARFFATGYRASVPRSDWASYEFASPRDGGGHGSHTASTAAGDYGVNTHLYGVNDGAITGVAPAAKLAVYKVLWSAANAAQDGGASSDVVAAIDQAVADGVDVINFSISGGPATSIDDPVSLAMLDAASAGIFVSTAAGNDGPGDATVGNVGPWETTPAASTWTNTYGTVVLGNGVRVRGQTITAHGLKGGLVYAGAAARVPTGSDGASAAECGAGTLSKRKVAGKIVLCDGGGSTPGYKALEVLRAHGRGMIVGNLADRRVSWEAAYLQTIHVGPDARMRIKRYTQSVGDKARARLVFGSRTGQPTTPRPQVAAFSSRGPTGVSPDILKPDITAPGVMVLAAVAPPSGYGQQFQFYDGTSMATPHIAGLAAYELGIHPHTPPASIRSAMMTTAYDTKTPGGARSGDVFAHGAGQVDPTRMLDPGLLFPESAADWLGYLEGQGVDTGGPVAPIDPADLNQPSIALGSLVVSRVLTRTVQNPTGHSERYTASYDGSRHLRVLFKHGPSFGPTATYLVGAHASTSIQVKVVARGGLGSWVMGHITLQSPRHRVRLPVAARPVPLSAPHAVRGSGTSGSLTLSGEAGFDGTLRAKVIGLVGAVPAAGTIDGDGGSFETPEVSELTVPAGTAVTRIDVDAGVGSDDLDLFLFADDGTPFNPNTDQLVAYSASGSAGEQILRRVAPGSYWVVVDGYEVRSAGGAYTLTSWNVPASDSGSLALSPTSQPARAGHAYSIDATWSGLSASQVYFGRVTVRRQGADLRVHTLVTITP